MPSPTRPPSDRAASRRPSTIPSGRNKHGTAASAFLAVGLADALASSRDTWHASSEGQRRRNTFATVSLFLAISVRDAPGWNPGEVRAMSDNALNPFPPEALEANRRGELTDTQLRAFRGLSGYRRKSALRAAGFLAMGALLIGFFAAPTFSAASRVLITFGGLAIAAFLVVRSINGGDALTRDLRRVRVESVEGAIGKNRISSMGEG